MPPLTTFQPGRAYFREPVLSALVPLGSLVPFALSVAPTAVAVASGLRTAQECLAPVLALDSCSRDCPDMESDYADCLYTTCASEWAEYESCWREKFVDGTCAADAGCVGLAP